MQPRVLSAVICGLLISFPATAHAQEPRAETISQPATGAAILRDAAEAGLGGPQSVGAQLEEDAAQRETPSRRPGVDAFFNPAESSLERLRAVSGLQVGLDYQAVYQSATNSLTDQTQASGGGARTFGKWQLLGRDAENTGSLVFLLEQRHELWNELTPAQLGSEIGYLGITGTTFSDSGASLTTLYWEQSVANGNAGFVAGRIDPTDFIDILGYANQRTTFLNLSSLVNPSIALPDPGFGFGAGAMVTEQIFVKGLVTDANGSLTDVKFFPGGDEVFAYGELGWTPARDERFLTNVHVGAWHVDERVDAGVPESHGIVVSANVTIDDVFMPFVRAGWSDGEAPFYSTAISGGFIYYFPRYRDLLGLAAAWNEPATTGLRDQATLEAFYRYQFSDNIAITADAQLLLNPALNPDEDQIAVFGLRARLDM
ncbi:MAG: carbohydrate porin [Methyloceanibacter sp.]|nr:carbohydrate porin [Methyloceanibacter sp.]